jgi:hypothetical protein
MLSIFFIFLALVFVALGFAAHRAPVVDRWIIHGGTPQFTGAFILAVLLPIMGTFMSLILALAAALGDL